MDSDLATTPRVVFVDLDGTVVLDNSFHLFLWAMWVRGGMRLRVALIHRSLCRLFAHGNGRVRMKHSLLRAFASSTPDRRSAIVNYTMSKLRQTVSHPVLARLSVMQDQGWLTVLATAAPDCYAKPFAQSLGIDDCLATPTVATRGEWAELIGEEKARACKSWVETRSMGTAAQLVAITDHYDDMPLLRMASRVIIQASTEEAAGLVAELSTEVPIEHIDPVTDEGVGGMWLWMDDRPAGPYDSWEVRTILSKHRHALLYKGNAQWGRVLPGGSLAEAALRAECPRPPAIRDRISIAARRRVVRDLLGIFH